MSELIVATGKHVYCGAVCDIKVVPTYWAGIMTGNYVAMVYLNDSWHNLKWFINIEETINWLTFLCEHVVYTRKDARASFPTSWEYLEDQ